MNKYQRHVRYLISCDKKITINRISKVTGISYQTVQRIKDGFTTRLSIERLNSILDLTPEMLLESKTEEGKDAKPKKHEQRKANPKKSELQDSSNHMAEPEVRQGEPQSSREDNGVQRSISPAVKEIFERQERKVSGQSRIQHHFPKKLNHRGIITYCLSHGGTYRSIGDVLGTSGGNIRAYSRGCDIPSYICSRIDDRIDKLELLLTN